MDSPPRTGSPTKSKSPKKTVTRYGAVKQADLKFGTEERFKWQSAQETSDVIYEMPELGASRSVLFGSALRKGMDEENPDAKKRSTGPGSYNFGRCFDHHSEYRARTANRFSLAPRQSMAMKTPSPGAVYNIEKQYWNGPVKNEGIGFANGERGELYGASLGANADMFFPKPETGPKISIAKRFKPRSLAPNSPGAIYNVHVRSNLVIDNTVLRRTIFSQAYTSSA